MIRMKRSRQAFLATTATITVIAAVAAPAYAQDSQTTSENVDENNVIVVTGVRESLKQALDIKRDSAEFVDALVAEDIAQFPDNNLAEALQRIPGITVERNDGGSQSTAIGEGAAINVRGLGPSFTRTEINGMTATNPGQGRGFGFNILASELFSKVVVSKSLSAIQNEGGLAGTVQLSTYRPLDYDERVLTVNVQGVYNDLAESFDPKGAIIFADQFDDGKFGIAAGFSYSKSDRREDIADASNWDFLRDSMRGNFALLTPAQQADLQNFQIPRDPRLVQNTRDHERINATLTLEAELSDRFKITFDNIYAKINQSGRQTRNDAPIEGFPATFLPTDLVRDGDTFLSGTFPAASHFLRIIDYDYGVKSELRQHTLSAVWEPTDGFIVKPHVGFASAEEDFFRWNSFDIRSDPTDITYALNGDFVTFDAAIGASDDPSVYTNISRIRNRPTFNEDKEFAAKVDFEWSPNDEFVKSIDFGVRYGTRDKTFRSFDGRASLPAAFPNLGQFLSRADFGVSGQPAGYPRGVVQVDFDGLLSAIAPNGFDSPEVMPARYDVNEKTFAGYALANLNIGNLVGNAGVRVVNTDQTSVGFQRVTDMGGVTTLLPASFNNKYTFVLPSFNAKWNISDTLVARFAAYKSLTRPELTDIQPARSFAAFNGGNGTAGNPNLSPFTAWNFDVGLEWYFADEAVLSVSYFRKELNGLIERIVEEVEVEDPVTGQPLLVNLSRPINGQSATIEGWEGTFQTPFTFLPGILKNTGIVLNATLTDSAAVFTNQNDIRSSSLPGLSDTSFNAIFYFDTEIFSSRIAYNWRSDYLIAVSGSGGLPVNRDSYGQLDFSATVNINENFGITLDVLNLTNNKIRSFSNFNQQQVKGLIETGRTVSIGANFKF